MTYPSRGDWRFRNDSRGFEFHPTLSSVAISDSQNNLATFSLAVVGVAPPDGPGHPSGCAERSPRLVRGVSRQACDDNLGRDARVLPETTSTLP
jgi:hypothetical protein